MTRARRRMEVVGSPSEAKVSEMQQAFYELSDEQQREQWLDNVGFELEALSRFGALWTYNGHSVLRDAGCDSASPPPPDESENEGPMLFTALLTPLNVHALMQSMLDYEDSRAEMTRIIDAMVAEGTWPAMPDYLFEQLAQESTSVGASDPVSQFGASRTDCVS